VRTKHVVSILLSILLMTSLIALPSFIITITSQTASANPSSENFTIVALPDTQNYSKSYPSIFENQTKWIVQKENENNIVFVTHLGDIVETASSTPQWINADNAMRILDNKVLYGVLPGNHDLQDGGTNYSSYFPPSRYSYWGGSYVSYGPDNNLNNYQLFSAGGMDFIVIDLQYNPPTNVRSWAGNVLDNYSNRRAIISTHSYLTYPGNLSDQGGLNIYNDLVVPHNNVFLVLCGHSYNSSTGYGEWKRIDNFGGRIVYGLLSDYQALKNPNDNKVCGNGYLRIMKFVPSENKIYVKTYSPWLDNYMTGSSSQFELTYPMEAPARGVTVSISPSSQDGFPGGILNYTVTVANTGDTIDNFTLTASDNAVPSWSPTVSPNSLLNVLPGENRTATLTVTIPDNAIPDTRDNMTVAATSAENAAVSDNANCTASVLNPFRVGVSISPSENYAENGQTVTFTVAVKNTGIDTDNYDLTVIDNDNWRLTLDNNRFENVLSGENRTTMLRVAIPDNATSGTYDNITVTATSQGDPSVENDASCIARAVTLDWEGTATFKLENLYTVSLEKDLQFNTGSKLVVKFYDYGNNFESEVVIENITPPQSVVENENVPHPPQGSLPVSTAVKRAELVLTTDNTENVISTIASFTVHQSHLRDRDKAILAYWGGHPELWPAFREEDKDILIQWGSAPP